jgi:hypothetical protein
MEKKDLFSEDNRKPTVIESNQVYTTTDYYLFKPIDGNRDLDLVHLAKLKKSMMENYLVTTIIVNEKFEIIDGQHRFEAIKDLCLPLNYQICPGYSLRHVHLYNQLTKTWNAEAYMAGYCKLGYKHYINYRKFKEKYKFGHNECMALLSGDVNMKGNICNRFKSGRFEITHMEKAELNAQRIYMFKDIYSGFKRRAFVYAILHLLEKPLFDFNEFLQKVKLQPSLLTNCTDKTQYIYLIEEIYNYKRRDKINLRF